MRQLTTSAICLLALLVVPTTASASSARMAQTSDAAAPQAAPLARLSPALAQEHVRLDVRPRVVRPGGSLVATPVNYTDGFVSYGLDYTIDRWHLDGWRETGLAPDVFPMILLRVRPGESGLPQEIGLPADAAPGLYRVTKRVHSEGNGTNVRVHGRFLIW